MLRIVALGFLLLASTAEAQTCTEITSLPAALQFTGCYRLKGTLGYVPASGAAITITGSSITLDLGGARIGNGTAGPGTTAVAVLVSGPRTGVVIQNGHIRGFYKGVVVDDPTSVSITIRDIRLELSRFRAIELVGVGHSVERVSVVNVGGSTVPGSSPTTGVLIQSGFIRDSNFANMDQGIAFTGGGKYRGNLTVGVGTPFTGGTDAGGNN